MVEEETAHQFLMGLDDESFSNIRSKILTLEPLPTLDRMFNIVLQEENHKTVMLGREERIDAVAFVVNHVGKVQQGAGAGGRITCKHCGRTGHEQANCYELIGYPLG